MIINESHIYFDRSINKKNNLSKEKALNYIRPFSVFSFYDSLFFVNCTWNQTITIYNYLLYLGRRRFTRRSKWWFGIWYFTHWNQTISWKKTRGIMKNHLCITINETWYLAQMSCVNHKTTTSQYHNIVELSMITNYNYTAVILWVSSFN